MGTAISPAMEYQVNGIALDTQHDKLQIDLSAPRTIFVQGENSVTGEKKLYMLRVTRAGGLVLQ